MILLAAAWFDFRKSRIPNLLIAAGLVIACACRIQDKTAAEAFVRTMLVFAGLYPFYLCGGLGAGDVKLIMTAAMFLGTSELLYVCAVGFGAAAAAGIFRRVVRKKNAPLHMACYLAVGVVCRIAGQVWGGSLG